VLLPCPRAVRRARGRRRRSPPGRLRGRCSRRPGGVMRSSGLFLGAGVLAAITALTAAPASAQFYEQHNLVSSESDGDLINPWGLTSSPTSPWWVADNGTNLSTLYNA